MSARHRRKANHQSVNGSGFGQRREFRRMKRIAERLEILKQQSKGMTLKKVF